MGQNNFAEKFIKILKISAAVYPTMEKFIFS
jgi:hypothetical protein